LARFIGPPLPLGGEIEHLGSVARASRSNDADFDDRGLVHLADRNVGFDMLKLCEN
jgi:hypothetical protein